MKALLISAICFLSVSTITAQTVMVNGVPQRHLFYSKQDFLERAKIQALHRTGKSQPSRSCAGIRAGYL